MEECQTLKSRKVAFYTLGCKLNFAETSSLGDRLMSEGMINVEAGRETADICIINTCSVTEVSDHKCRQTIHKAIRENPNAFVVVMGCYAQLSGAEIAKTEGVDLVVGMEFKGHIADYIKEMYPIHEEKLNSCQMDSLHKFIQVSTKDIKSFVPSCSHGNRTRYFLKVQDGCNYFCTYCTIPYARGKSRNGSIASMVEQAREAAENGGKEIVITGVNIGDFGKSTGESFIELIKALDQVEGIERYRISSIEPNLLTNEVIDFCAQSKKFMPHFHIPLQSGSDEVLKMMHRRYDKALFADKVAYIKEKMPDAFIGVDIIIGTRGERDGLFEESYQFAKEIDVAQYHVFSYSERPGTMALKIPFIVSEQEKHRRSQKLLELSDQKLKAFYQQHLGETRPVLTEHPRLGMPVKGFTDNYIRVEITDMDDQAILGTIIPVKLIAFNQDQTAIVGCRV